MDEVIARIRQADLAEEYRTLAGETMSMARPHVQKAHEAATRGVASIDGFSHGINDGPAAGQTIPHLHYHIIPRRQGDVANPACGYGVFSRGRLFKWPPKPQVSFRLDKLVRGKLPEMMREMGQEPEVTVLEAKICSER